MRSEATAVTELRAVVRARFDRSAHVPTAFFEAHATAIAHACRALARAFHGGGRMFALGDEAQWSDALHVSVEFVHPVILGKRALPAIALDRPTQLAALAVPGDIALGATDKASPWLHDALGNARSHGLLTIALTGRTEGAWTVDHHFAVPADDPFVVQEVHETCYHVFWELVHVFLDHPTSLQ